MTALSNGLSRISPQWRDALEGHGYFAENCGSQSDRELLQIAVEVASAGSNLVVSPISIVGRSSIRSMTPGREVFPMHTDGMYLDDIPRYVVLFCDTPPASGGETALISGEAVVARMAPELRAFLIREPIRIRVAGHTRVRPLVAPHPERDQLTFSFIDPSLDPACELEVGGRPLDPAILREIRNVIATTPVMHRHRWRAGDLLIFDNLTCLHGRSEYSGDRRLRRILVATNKAGI